MQNVNGASFQLKMLKVFRIRNVLLCGLLPEFVEEKRSLDDYKTARGLYIEDPWERVKTIFMRDQFGGLHPELNYVLETVNVAAIIGFMYGGGKKAIPKCHSFAQVNEATTYGTKREALSAIVNQNTLSFLKGGFRWAPIFAIFTGTFTLVTTCCEAYRNKPHITDSTIAGSVIGGISRCMFGIKGVISGAVIGGTLGSIYGFVVWGISRISNRDQVELKYAHYALLNYRKQMYNHAVSKKQREDEIIEKTGLHVPHVVNPLDELDSEKKEPAKNSEEKTDK